MFKEIVQYRQLLFSLAWRDIKIRYKQTVMGYMWAIFMPMLVVAAGIFVKKAFSILSGDPMDLSAMLSVGVKAIPFSFFLTSIRFSTNSLIGNTNLITKIYFPREVFPFASTIASLFDFLISSVTLAVILIFANIGISIYILWLPILLIFLITITTGIGMMLACANLFYRDVKYIVEVIAMFAIFFTPVFYDSKMFGKWETLLLLNPLGSILECLNAIVILHQPPNYFWLAYSGFWGIVVFLISWKIFHQLEFAFAEYI